MAELEELGLLWQTDVRRSGTRRTAAGSGRDRALRWLVRSGSGPVAGAAARGAAAGHHAGAAAAHVGGLRRRGPAAARGDLPAGHAADPTTGTTPKSQLRKCPD